MITRSNSKLGSNIWGWSIPAGDTCPGASEVCELLCYAKRGRYYNRNVQEAHKRNDETRKEKEFVNWMIAEIRKNSVQIMRIHVAGDFDTPAYVRKWIKIIRACRRTKFYAYTRSWTDAKIRPVLAALATESNLYLWLSWDQSMDFPVKMANTRTCYLSRNDDDMPSQKTDLVFRDKDKTLLKFAAHHSQVCPYEQGVQRKIEMSCTKCQICFTKAKVKRETQPSAPGQIPLRVVRHQPAAAARSRNPFQDYKIPRFVHT